MAIGTVRRPVYQQQICGEGGAPPPNNYLLDGSPMVNYIGATTGPVSARLWEWRESPSSV